MCAWATVKRRVAAESSDERKGGHGLGEGKGVSSASLSTVRVGWVGKTGRGPSEARLRVEILTVDQTHTIGLLRERALGAAGLAWLAR